MTGLILVISFKCIDKTFFCKSNMDGRNGVLGIFKRRGVAEKLLLKNG